MTETFFWIALIAVAGLILLLKPGGT